MKKTFLLDSREEIESEVREGENIRFFAFYDQKGIFRVALGVKRSDSEMAKSVKELFPGGYKTITYGNALATGEILARRDYWNAAPSIQERLKKSIEGRIRYFFK